MEKTCNISPILKPKIMCCPGLWCNPQANHKCPSVLCSCEWGYLAIWPSLSRGPGRVAAYFWGVGFNFLPVWGIIQTSQSSPVETRPFTLLKLLQPLLYHSVPECIPQATLRDMWCPLAPGSESMWLTNCCWSHLSSVRSCVFGHPHKPRAGVPPSPTGWRGGD